MTTTGHCNCSSITVTLDQMPQRSAVCYCANCKRSGSGLCSVVYFLDRSAVKVDDPKSYLKTYQDSNTTTGNTVHRAFCSNCGSPVYSSMGADAPMLILKGGLFDEIPEPAQEFFTEKRPHWVSVAKTTQ